MWITLDVIESEFSVSKYYIILRKGRRGEKRKSMFKCDETK